MQEYAQWIEETLLIRLRRLEPEVLDAALSRLADFVASAPDEDIQP